MTPPDTIKPLNYSSGTTSNEKGFWEKVGETAGTILINKATDKAKEIINDEVSEHAGSAAPKINNTINKNVDRQKDSLIDRIQK